MQNYTQEYLNKIRSQTREMKGYVTFNGDSTKVLAGNSGLVSLKVHQSAMEEERYCIGSVCSSYCEMTFFNSGLPSGVSLANSYFDAYIGIVMGVVNQVNLEQYTCMGRFYITEISRGKETTQVVGYDVTSRLNKDYAPTVTKTAQGYLVMDILNDIIDQCGVNNGTHFTDVGNNVYVQQIFEGTCKEQWGWLMSLCNSDGKCYFGSRTDLGMIEGRGYTDGSTVYDSYPALDDAVIYLDGYSDGDDFTVNSLTTGTDDSPIVIGNGVGINAPNPYMTETQATAIYNTLHGVTFTPMNLHFRGDMMIDLFDSLKVTQDGTDHRCVVMSVETTFNGGLEQTIECWGDSEEYYAMSSGRMNTIESKVSTNSTMLQEIAQSIETARGGVITQVLDTDGTWKELVIANSQDLSQATSVWRFNIEGLAHSTRYTGGVYSFALDDDGNIVANRIQVGTLQDAAGKNSWNMETGALQITDGSIVITFTKTYKHTDYSQSDLTIMTNFIAGSITFTDAQWEKYSINGDGVFRMSDLVRIRNMINYGRDTVKTVTVAINPEDTTRAIKVDTTVVSPTNATTGTSTTSWTTYYDGESSKVPRGQFTTANAEYFGKYATETNAKFYGDIYPNQSINNYTNKINDFVIEKGYSSPWYWRKWNSGYAEAWARVAHTLNFSQAWGTVYTADIDPEAYPFSFRDGTQPIEQVSAVGAKSGTDNSCWLCNYGGQTGPTHLQTGKYQAIRPVSGSATIRIAYYVRGLL